MGSSTKEQKHEHYARESRKRFPKTSQQFARNLWEIRRNDWELSPPIQFTSGKIYRTKRALELYQIQVKFLRILEIVALPFFQQRKLATFYRPNAARKITNAWIIQQMSSNGKKYDEPKKNTEAEQVLPCNNPPASLNKEFAKLYWNL